MTKIELPIAFDTLANFKLRGVSKLAAFAGLIVAVAFLLHALISMGLRRIETSSFGVSNQIVDGRINADILISGSSRALTHYDPRIISRETGLSAFNIGLNGSQTDMQLARLKVYLRHNNAPVILIQNIDIFSMQTTHNEVYDPAQYVPYLDQDDFYRELQKIDPNIWKSKYIPLYGYTADDLRFTWVEGLLRLVGINKTEDHFNGFKPRDATWTEDFDRLKAKNPNGMKFEIEPEGLSTLEELLSLCRNRNIKVIMVYSPEYIEMQQLTRDRAAAFKRFEKLAQQFDAEFWDYSASEISSQQANFYNSQHLNSLGAEKFSMEFARRIAAEQSTLTRRGANEQSPP